MKEIDVKKMYGYNQQAKKEKQHEEREIQLSKDIVLIETKGKKTAVPSMEAFARLANEYDILKKNHVQTAKELNVLRESVKLMVRAINTMDDELKKKIDKLDD